MRMHFFFIFTIKKNEENGISIIHIHYEYFILVNKRNNYKDAYHYLLFLLECQLIINKPLLTKPTEFFENALRISNKYMHVVVYTHDSKGLPLTSYNICHPNHILPWLQVMWMQPRTDICSWES